MTHSGFSVNSNVVYVVTAIPAASYKNNKSIAGTDFQMISVTQSGFLVKVTTKDIALDFTTLETNQIESNFDEYRAKCNIFWLQNVCYKQIGKTLIL